MPYSAPKRYPANVPISTVAQPYQSRTAPMTRASFTSPNPKPLLIRKSTKYQAPQDEGAEQRGRPAASSTGHERGGAQQNERGRGERQGEHVGQPVRREVDGGEQHGGRGEQEPTTSSGRPPVAAASSARTTAVTEATQGARTIGVPGPVRGLPAGHAGRQGSSGGTESRFAGQGMSTPVP